MFCTWLDACKFDPISYRGRLYMTAIPMFNIVYVYCNLYDSCFSQFTLKRKSTI